MDRQTKAYLYAGATVLLGSATPSLESRYNAARDKYKLLELPERIERNMRHEFAGERMTIRARIGPPKTAQLAAALGTPQFDRLAKELGVSRVTIWRVRTKRYRPR